MIKNFNKNSSGEITTAVALFVIVTSLIGIVAGYTAVQSPNTFNTKSKAAACAEVTSVSYSPNPLGSGTDFRCNVNISSQSVAASENSMSCGWSKNGGWPQNGGRWQNAGCDGTNCHFDIRMDSSLDPNASYELVGFDSKSECGPTAAGSRRINISTTGENPSEGGSIDRNCRPSIREPAPNKDFGTNDVKVGWNKSCAGAQKYQVYFINPNGTQITYKVGNFDTVTIPQNSAEIFSPKGRYQWGVSACWIGGEAECPVSERGPWSDGNDFTLSAASQPPPEPTRTPVPQNQPTNTPRPTQQPTDIPTRTPVPEQQENPPTRTATPRPNEPTRTLTRTPTQPATGQNYQQPTRTPIPARVREDNPPSGTPRPTSTPIPKRTSFSVAVSNPNKEPVNILGIYFYREENAPKNSFIPEFSQDRPVSADNMTLDFAYTSLPADVKYYRIFVGFINPDSNSDDIFYEPVKGLVRHGSKHTIKVNIPASSVQLSDRVYGAIAGAYRSASKIPVIGYPMSWAIYNIFDLEEYESTL